jgi:hypothetical protein
VRFGRCHLCQRGLEVEFCGACGHWFCGECGKHFFARGLAAFRELVEAVRGKNTLAGDAKNCCGPRDAVRASNADKGESR